MAKFFVGQRVRIVRVFKQKNSHLVGKEGRITGISIAPPETAYGLDISPLRATIEGGVAVVHGFYSDQLSPVLPEGEQPCSESYEQLMDRLRSGVVA